MAGTGRSGGRNRKTFGEHDLAGTLRLARGHQPDALTPDGHRRLDELRPAYEHTVKVLEYSRGIGRGSAVVMREIRQFTTLLLQLDAAIDRAERRIPPTPAADAFEEFQ